MDLLLEVVAVDRAEEDLHLLTQEFCLTINRETDLDARLALGEPVVGTRGDPITVGHLVLTFLTSGTAVALFQVIKAYVERDRAFKAVFKRADGACFEIGADNLSGTQVDQTMTLLDRFMGGADS